MALFLSIVTLILCIFPCCITQPICDNYWNQANGACGPSVTPFDISGLQYCWYAQATSGQKWTQCKSCDNQVDGCFAKNLYPWFCTNGCWNRALNVPIIPFLSLLCPKRRVCCNSGRRAKCDRDLPDGYTINDIPSGDLKDEFGGTRRRRLILTDNDNITISGMIHYNTVDLDEISKRSTTYLRGAPIIINTCHPRQPRNLRLRVDVLNEFWHTGVNDTGFYGPPPGVGGGYLTRLEEGHRTLDCTKYLWQPYTDPDYNASHINYIVIRAIDPEITGRYTFSVDLAEEPQQCEPCDIIQDRCFNDGYYPGSCRKTCPCRPTAPITDPTADPTTDPTTDPTADPTVHPAADPTRTVFEIAPTTDPTADPTTDPTADPTTDPTADPVRESTLIRRRLLQNELGCGYTATCDIIPPEVIPIINLPSTIRATLTNNDDIIGNIIYYEVNINQYIADNLYSHDDDILVINTRFETINDLEINVGAHNDQYGGYPTKAINENNYFDEIEMNGLEGLYRWKPYNESNANLNYLSFDAKYANQSGNFMFKISSMKTKINNKCIDNTICKIPRRHEITQCAIKAQFAHSM